MPKVVEHLQTNQNIYVALIANKIDKLCEPGIVSETISSAKELAEKHQWECHITSAAQKSGINEAIEAGVKWVLEYD